MTDFINLLQLIVILFIVLIVLFFSFLFLLAILLALPKSKFRSFALEAMGWTGGGASLLWIASPIDLIPEFIPIAGELDDVGYIISGIICAITIYMQRKNRQRDFD